MLALLLLSGVMAAHAATATPPRVFLLDRKMLEQARAGAGDPMLVKAVRTAAGKAMQEGPFSVMQKSITPPSGDKHDYMSQAPYFWADPKKPDGLPYIRRDGERNPEIRKITDHDELGRMAEVVRVLALNYYLTDDTASGDRAALLLRTWFLDPATRMNPNLEFGQGIPGINTGRGIGLIETRGFTSVVDAVGLLAGSKDWTAADQKGMQQWFTQFLNWMQTSQKGWDEAAAKNNHGTYYDLQAADYALFIGRQNVAVAILKSVSVKRITLQIEPDGRQPLELARTKAFSYSTGNLEGLMELALLGDEEGVNLWGFRTADGRCLRAALDFLLPYATEAKKWNYQQIGGFHGDDLLHPLLRAAAKFQDPEYIAAAKKMVASHQDASTLLIALP